MHEYGPLTTEEAAVWLHQVRRPLSPAYNICALLEITGSVDPYALRRAVEVTVAAQRLSRTVVQVGEEELNWYELPTESRVRVVAVPDATDVQTWVDADGRDGLLAEARGPFLLGAPVSRFVHWDLGRVGAVLQITIHHSAADGLSLRRLVDEMIHRYGDPSNAGSPRRAPTVYQPLVTPAEAAAFWRPRLTLAESCDLLTPSARVAGAVDDGVVLTRTIEIDVASEGAVRARTLGTSLFGLALAGLIPAVASWSGQQRFAIRVPFSHRPLGDDEISYRVRTLPLQLFTRPGEDLATLVARTRDELRAGAMHADWGATVDRDAMGLKGAGTSLVVVNQLQPAGLLTHRRPAPITAAGLHWRPRLLHNGTAKFDCTVYVALHDGRLGLSAEYRRGRYDAQEMGWFADYAAAAVADAFTCPPDRSAHVLGRSSTASQSNPPPTRGSPTGGPGARLDELFLAAAQANVHRAAVVEDHPQGTRVVSYEQLADASGTLAASITSMGIGAGQAIAVRLPRGAPLYAAVFAVLRARAALLLLDPKLPAIRATHMLADSRAALVVDDGPPQAGDPVVPLWDGSTLRLRALNEPAQAVPLAAPHLASDVAYIMYTSGSTGQPKGVAVSHAGIANRLSWMQRTLPIGPDRVVLAKTPLSFDVCLWELLWPASTGATVITAQPGRHGDAEYLVDVVDRYGVDTVHFVPAMLGAFLDLATGLRCAGMRQIITSGEPLPLALAQRVHARLGLRVHNLYGPTEASIDVTRWTFDPDDRRSFVPIGRPIDNITVEVCDPDSNPMPAGAIGEIVLRGVGVALGYLGDGSLDHGRFGRHPASGERTYRTGDLGRWRGGGVLEFLGRADSQIKINGVRVELDEIEAVLAGHPAVRAAAVLYRPDAAGPGRLQALLVRRGDARASAEQLRAHAVAHLPTAVVPTAFVEVDALPYSANGKLDRAALPSVVGRHLAADAAQAPAAPAYDNAAALGAALHQVLSEQNLPDGVDLFHLGLDSINVLRLVSILRQDGLAVTVADVFEARTITALLPRLERTTTAPLPPSAADPAKFAAPWRGRRVERRFPLSSLQLGLVFHRDVSADYLTYVTSLDLDGMVDAGRLRAAIAVAAGRHEFVRSVIDLSADGGPEQVVLAEVTVDLIEHDLTDLEEPAQADLLRDWQMQVRRRVIPWDEPPLFAFHLHRLAEDRAVLSIVEPFLDGWSVTVLAREILDAYETATACRDARPVPDSATRPAAAVPSYATFVDLERAAADDPDALAYWRAVIDEPDVAWRLAIAPAAALPAAWGRHDHFLEGAHLDLLRQAASQLEVSLRTLLLAVHMYTVGLFAAAQRVGSALMVNGRPEQPGADAMCGLFLNIMPVTVELPDGLTWRQLVAELVHAEQASWRHRRTPYAVLRRLRPDFASATVFNFTEFHPYRELFTEPTRALRIRQITALDQTYLVSRA